MLSAEVGGIGDDSGVLFSRSRAVIWKDRHDPFGNMAFACLCGAPSLIVISKCSKMLASYSLSEAAVNRGQFCKLLPALQREMNAQHAETRGTIHLPEKKQRPNRKKTNMREKEHQFFFLGFFRCFIFFGLLETRYLGLLSFLGFFRRRL